MIGPIIFGLGDEQPQSITIVFGLGDEQPE